jgi:hypothetical protein
MPHPLQQLLAEWISSNLKRKTITSVSQWAEVATKAKKILPHWVFRVKLETTDANQLVHISWLFKIGRKVMV